MTGAPCLVRRRVDQSAPDATPPQLGIDEETIELGEAVVPLHHGEPRDPAAQLGDRHLFAFNERQRKFDRVGIRLEMRAIRAIRQRSTPLQIFQALAFAWLRRPKPDLSAL